MKKFKKILWISLGIIIVILALIIYWRFYFTYSEGYRAGILQKVSYKGNVFKTYEGEMILSSIESNRNAAIASEKFLFSVPDERVARKLIAAEGQTVTIHYRETHSRLFWRGDSKYLVDSLIVNKPLNP